MTPQTLTGTSIALDGIPLEIPDPWHYLAVLKSVLPREHPEVTAASPAVQDVLRLAPDLETPLDRRSTEPVIGYNGPVMASLIDREWAATERTESDALIRYLADHRLITDERSILILGAGTCRLGDALASLDPHRTVMCSDLSWLALYFGRAIVEQAVHRLPPVVREVRTYYVARHDEQGHHLDAHRRPHAFAEPRCHDPSQLRYVVRNAFHPFGGHDGELVIAPYLLDCTVGPHLITMVIRLMQQITRGQDLLLVMSCLHPHRSNRGRDPQTVAATVADAGFEITHLDLLELPYSFSLHGYGYWRVWPNTLVLRARRVAARDDDRIQVSRAITEAQSEQLMSETARHVFDCCREPTSYRALRRLCGATVDETSFETAIGDLCAKDLLTLSLR